VKERRIRVVMAVPQEILVEMGVVILEVQILLVKERRIRVVMAVPQEILVEMGVVILEVQILLMKGTRIRVVMAGRTMTIAKVKEQREKKYSKITNGIFPAQDSKGGFGHLGCKSGHFCCKCGHLACKSRGGFAIPQDIVVERGVVILEVQILLMKETRIRVVMAGRTLTIAKIEEQREKKYSKITNGVFV
jgi:hypothetical protein